MKQRTAHQDAMFAGRLSSIALEVFHLGLKLALGVAIAMHLMFGPRQAVQAGVGAFALVALVWFVLNAISASYSIRAENKRVRALREIRDWEDSRNRVPGERNGRQV